MKKAAELLKKISNKSIDEMMTAPRCKPSLFYQPSPPSKVMELYKDKK